MTLRMSHYLNDSGLMLPGHPDFNRILATPPPDPDRRKDFVVRKGGSLLESIDSSGLDEYFESGEYEERLEEIEEIESDLLYLPVSITLKQ